MGSFKQMAPLLIVLSLAGYCCWVEEYGTPASPPGNEKNAKLEISQALLAPLAAATPVRDPFGNPAVKPKKPMEVKKTFSAGQLLSEAKKLTASMAIQDLPNQANPANDGDTAKAKGVDLANITKNLALRGTFVMGQRRLAMINDRFYAEGETLAPSVHVGVEKNGPATDAPAMVVTGIFADKVILGFGKHVTELKFSEKKSVTAAKPAQTNLELDFPAIAAGVLSQTKPAQAKASGQGER